MAKRTKKNTSNASANDEFARHTNILIASLLAIALAFNVTAFEVWAYGGEKGKRNHDGLEEKFFYKAEMLLKNREELGLSDAQIEKIKDLEVKTKKDLIQKKADIEIAGLDIKQALYVENIDTAGVNKLIDKKYDLKKEKAKSMVGAYAALKRTLTDEQKDKLRAIWEKCKEEKTRYSKEGKKSCPMKDMEKR